MFGVFKFYVKNYNNRSLWYTQLNKSLIILIVFYDCNIYNRSNKTNFGQILKIIIFTRVCFDSQKYTQCLMGTIIYFYLFLIDYLFQWQVIR